MSARSSLALTCLFLFSCRGAFTVPPEPSETAGVLPRCSEIGLPLSIESMSPTVGAGQLFVLTAAGGTGAYRWSLADNNSGAEIDPNAGVYVAGSPMPTMEMPDTVDVVLLEDNGCSGDTTIGVTVVDAPQILPSRVALEPGQSLTFMGEGGSGTYEFELAPSSMSGGTVGADGRYTAGSALGRDVVRLTDTLLESSAEAIVDVVRDASLSITTTEWVIPVGNTVALPITGGSGVYDVSVGGSFTHLDGTTVEATMAGTTTATFTDRFTGRSLMVSLTAIEPHDASRLPNGDRYETHIIRAADADNDGDLDAIVAMESFNGDWFESGAVMIFENDAGTLGTTPARVISGWSRSMELGHDIQIADLDGDGLNDLIVGARRADPIRVDIGAVYVYGGVDGELFSEAPVRTFIGSNSYDYFGGSVAVCDFNGDGALDLAVGAELGQDPDGARDQGVVQVFLAYPGGRFISSPDNQLFGLGVDAGEVTDVGDMRLGGRIAAGDYDGDGVCDLAAYASEAQPDVRDTGAVFLYRGVACELDPVSMECGADRAGLEPTPSLIWARADATDDNAQFGQDLLMGDVNGDGRADLIATRYLHDGADGTDTGAIYARYGRDFSGAATAITDIDAGADWSREGLASDRMGNAADLFDVNGDGQLDVISGDSRAEVLDGEIDRPGMIRIYHGGGDLPSTPDVEHRGPRAGSRFGLGVGAIGDYDGDGNSELLAFAPYHDTVDGMNDDVGALFLQRSGRQVADSTADELTLPIRASGQLVGFSSAWIGDLNSDGFPELAVASPRSDVVGIGRNAGMVRIYAGTASGTSSAVAQEIVGITGQGDSEELGWQVAPAGDFDGDGIPDLVVLGRSDDLAETPDPMIYQTVGTCVARSNPGSFYVFRGRTDGTVEAEPMLIYFGPYASQRFEDILGGVDVNGDMIDDIIVGGREWDPGGESNAGGVGVVFGRARAMDGRIIVVCDADVQLNGTIAGDRLGDSLVPMGDLDADGCEDFAAGSSEADPGDVRDAGEVTVFFGFDDSIAMRCGIETSFTRTVLFGSDRDSHGGTALGGGVDLGTDAVPDLVVGEPRYRDGRGEVGRVVLVDGARIAANVGGRIPFVDPVSMNELVLDGTTAGEFFGSAIAVMRGSGRGLVVIGGPFGASSGIVNTGGAAVFETTASGFVTTPRIQIAGESIGMGQLGSNLSVMRAGARAFVSVGAHWSSMVEPDDGASYAFSFTP